MLFEINSSIFDYFSNLICDFLKLVLCLRYNYSTKNCTKHEKRTEFKQNGI